MLVVLASVAVCAVSKTIIARSPERTMTMVNTWVIAAMEAVRGATAIVDGNAMRQCQLPLPAHVFSGKR